MARIGRYEIIESLGTGAMGRVYRARDTVLEREVALKTIHTGIDTSSEIRQRFQREARACARLRHPNIITVFDLGEAEDLSYIAMELLHGADFRRLIQERRDVPTEKKIEAAAQICEALAYAHREGLVHRDIKPSNLFLTDDGCAKILDFGIARLPASDLTMRGQVLGTPKYMAPEQIQGHPTDGRADLFSLAVVLFEMLTGVHPFQGQMTPQRIVQGVPESLLTHAPTLPPALERVIARGLEKDPEQRYATGDEFARALREAMGSQDRVGAPAVAGAPPAAPVRVAEAKLPGAPVSEPPPPPKPAVDCPPGQDPEEWRLSEALRLLPEFEAAVERRDIPAARGLLSDLEARLEGDIRFAEALRLCRSRMPFQTAPTPPPEAKAATAVETPAAPPRPPAPGEVDVDATMFGRTLLRTELPRLAPQPPPPPVTPVPPPPAPSPGVTAPPPRPAPPKETPPASPPQPRTPEPQPRPTAGQPAPQPAPPVPSPGRSARWIWIAGLLVCGAALAVGAYLYLQPPALEPAVATASVGPVASYIYSNPSAGESVVASVPAGAQVNVLSLPVQRDQEWTRVQLVHPSVTRPGYIHTSALRDWHAQTVAGAVAAAQLAGVEETGTADQMAAQADQLSDLAGRNASDPAAQSARLEAARLRVAAARRARDGGAPASEWTAYLRKAQDDLRSVTDPQQRDAAADLSQQAAAMLSSVKSR